MKVTFKTTGFRELERALAEDLPKATARNTLRRTAINAMGKIEQRAKELAPSEDGTLRESITTKPVKASRTSSTRFARASGVEVATGPAPVGKHNRANAGWQEEGTVNMQPNAYMRPAYDSEAQNVIGEIRDELALQIGKAKDRIARKLAKGR